MDETNSPQENFSSHWGWYSALYILSKENILRFTEVSQLPLTVALNYLTYTIDLDKQKQREIKKIRNGSLL